MEQNQTQDYVLQISDSLSIRTRLQELALQSAGDFLILPRGIQSADSTEKLFHESSALTLVKLWKESSLSVNLVQPQQGRLGILQENNLTWVAPTLFVGSMLLTGNPAAVSLALNVLGNYVTEFFRGRLGKGRVKLDIIVELPSGACKKVHYEGPPEGLIEVRRCVREFHEQ